ncbi:universal stress protein UspA [Pokkaliibacter plantistimulans]|uniref:Universal stress protein n=2 Tax=Pseudomonadota TaxID=1224 RepID=A0ABX5LXG7_9GAMM|nr:MULTISPECIES: universal stress protein [Pokkaliibacter]MDH2436516.1 universal stress protein [Pokkaliibacter sp. MBI-7]PPC77371.1 universal stress protein UspA [Pokkaliibacter plantistimulans]PXF30839.1 universal stress protein UspA [Pokkaliibacter plantistimulans]
MSDYIRSYEHILLAVDLTEEANLVAAKAATIASNSGAKLSIIHVIEPLSFAYGGDVPMDLSNIQTQLEEHAHKRLESFAANMSVAPSNLVVATGHTESEIHRQAETLGCDLIVVGSHGRHGLALLLGSTANSVLHGAKCDVLAVRVGDEKTKS